MTPRLGAQALQERKERHSREKKRNLILFN